MDISELDTQAYILSDSFIKYSQAGLREKVKVAEITIGKVKYRLIFGEVGGKFLLNHVEARLATDKELPDDSAVNQIARIEETILFQNATTRIVAPVVLDLLNKELADIARFYFTLEDDGTLEIWYEINRNDSILSITYYGYYYHKQAAHPSNYIYTQTIDMSTGEPILAKDLPLPSIQEILSSENMIWVTPKEQENITSIKEYLLAEIATGLWDEAELDKPNAPVNNNQEMRFTNFSQRKNVVI